MNTDELSAREHIRELIASYTHLGDGGRLDALVSLFEPDAWLETRSSGAAPVRHQGRDAIGAFFGGIVSTRADGPATTFVRHHIANVTITLTGADTASGASYWSVYGDRGFESSGRYRDTYHRGADDVWRFSSRTIRRDEPRPPSTVGGTS